jgi:glycosyltransferase involved in cell wall biosynthesis
MESDAPLITTIIPTYRRPTLLRRAIRSVLAQTYPRFQVCVYDNASGDETAAVVAELARDDPRVKYHCHPENIGMSANFIYGMERIDTPYFSVLSDDDYLLPTFYETALAGFAAHPDAMLSGGSVVSMTEAGQITHIPMNLWERDGYFSPPDGLFEWTIPKHPYITALLFRADVIDRVGTIDPNLLNGDYDFEWRVVSRFPYVVSREPCAVIMMHDSQVTRVSDPDAWLHSYRVMRAHLADNQDITAPVRARAATLLAGTFADAIGILGFTALRGKGFSSARKAATLLDREFGRHRRARALGFLATACERLPPLHACLNRAYRLVLVYRGVRTRATRARIAAATPME